jgi:hypothetical protein
MLVASTCSDLLGTRPLLSQALTSGRLVGAPPCARSVIADCWNWEPEIGCLHLSLPRLLHREVGHCLGIEVAKTLPDGSASPNRNTMRAARVDPRRARLFHRPAAVAAHSHHAQRQFNKPSAIGIGNMELCLQLETVDRTRYEDHFWPPRSLPQMPD